MNFGQYATPSVEESGFIKYYVQCNPDFKTRDGEQFPTKLVMGVETSLAGFLGKEGQTEPKEIFSAKINLIFLFDIKKPEHTKEQLLNYMWYFQAQAALLSRGYIRDLLKETSLSMLPIPYSIQSATAS